MNRLNRYRKVFAVLARHGFGDLVARLGPQRVWKRIFFKPSKLSLSSKRDTWIRIRKVLEELGPTYIKFGQVLSNRPGLLPDELVEELSKLQDSVQTVDFSLIKQSIESESGKTLEQLFQSIEEKSIASASIAQVHRAILKDGTEVAVKVQRPGIEQIIRADIVMMYDIAGLIHQYVPELRSLQLKEIVKVFERTILMELDFRKEKEHILQFIQLFEGEKRLVLPEPIDLFNSTHVLITRFIKGTKISKLDELTSSGKDLKDIARLGFDLYFQQIFEFGFFHADPHPGNLLVLDDGRLCILDFGMVGRLNAIDKLVLTQLIIGLGKDDIPAIVATIQKLSKAEIEDRKSFEEDVAAFIQEFGCQAVKNIDLNALLEKARAMVLKHKLQLNPDLFLLFRTVSMLEGLGITLDPDFRSLDYIKPYAVKLIRKQLNFKTVFNRRKILSTVLNLADFAQRFPSDSIKIFDKVLNNELKVNIENKSSKALQNQLDKTGKLISQSLLISAFLLVSFGLIGSGMYFNRPYAEGIGWGLMTLVLLLSVRKIFQVRS